jgi:gamma-glutamylcyclotransferase (GGCT)/AIG2-like uncharacterized protein YtfP
MECDMNGFADGAALPVFVYGTLRRGQHNYRLLRDRTVAEHPAVLPGHALHDAGLPYVVPGTAADRVVGELMVVHPSHYAEVLQALDWLEGHRPGQPSHYVRVRATVQVRDRPHEREVEAWVYLAGERFQPSAATLVASGDWLAARRRPTPVP